MELAECLTGMAAEYRPSTGGVRRAMVMGTTDDRVILWLLDQERTIYCEPVKVSRPDHAARGALLDRVAGDKRYELRAATPPRKLYYWRQRQNGVCHRIVRTLQLGRLVVYVTACGEGFARYGLTLYPDRTGTRFCKRCARFEAREEQASGG